MHKAERPEETDPVILFTELNAPEIVFLTSDPAPLITPRLPYKGPFTNPSIGFSTKSFTPEDIF